MPLGRAFATLVAFLVLTLQSVPAFATSDFSLDWKTIETPHFLIHYHSGLEDLARNTAVIAEETHIVLSPLLGWEPGSRTHVVLTDFGDSANGSARVVPYNLINLLAAAPDIRGTLNDYDDWLRGLFYHEYVHILHIDTITGFSAVVNTIFGKTAAPNGTLPRWYTEGLATYYESQRTSAGRVRNSIFSMFLRSAALENDFFSLGKISGTPVDHPGVTAWYLYGSHFVAYIAEKHGELSLTDYNHLYGDRFIPYALNIVAREAFHGDDLPTLYEEWQTAFEAKSLAQWVGIQARGGPTDYQVISGPTLAHDHLRKRPRHNQLSYVKTDGESTPSIVLYDLDTREEHVIVERFGSGRHSWSPDGSWLVTAESVPFKRVYRFGDLYLYNLRDGTSRRLTEGRRAREPSVSPDGETIAFVALRQGTTDLWLLDVHTGDTTLLYEGDGLDYFSTPEWLPDGQRLVLSRFHGERSGQRDLFLFDTATRSFTQLTDDMAVDIEPALSPDGRYVVWSSDRTGIYDLYALDLQTDSVHRLTRTISGFFSPAFDPANDRMLATAYSADGYDVAILDLQASIDADLAPAPRTSRPADIIEYSFPDFPMEEKSYRPWRYLWPRTWLPEFVTGLQFDGLYGLTLGGSDPVGHHLWLGSLSYDVNTDDLAGGFSWLYTRLPFNLQLRGSRRVTERRYRGSAGQESYEENQISVGVDTVFPFPGKDSQHNLSASYTVTHFSAEEPLNPNKDPVGSLPAFPELGFFNNLSLGWTFFSTERYNQSISTEWGFISSLGLRLRSAVLGADYNSVDVTWALTGYVPIPFIANHVLAARYAGGIGWGDYNRRGLFVVGGIPEQDVLQSLINGFGIGGTLLRGYPPVAQFGDQYHQINAEYRFPIWDIEEGYDTFPLYLGRLHGAVFSDAGTAFFDELDLEEALVSVGAEVRMQTLVGYFLPAQVRLGYAYGIMESGFHHIYMVLGSQF